MYVKDKAKLFQEATKTRPHFSLPKVIIQVQTGLEYSIGKFQTFKTWN